MADARLDGVAAAEVARDRLRLGGRLDDHKTTTLAPVAVALAAAGLAAAGLAVRRHAHSLHVLVMIRTESVHRRGAPLSTWLGCANRNLGPFLPRSRGVVPASAP